MESVKFEELGLYPQLLRAIKEMGFEEATPIQAQAIPVVMSGVDVIGQAQTGTGKDRIISVFRFFMKSRSRTIKRHRQSCFAPTRELAIQSGRGDSQACQNICMASKCFRYTEDRISDSQIQAP